MLAVGVLAMRVAAMGVAVAVLLFVNDLAVAVAVIMMADGVVMHTI